VLRNKQNDKTKIEKINKDREDESFVLFSLQVCLSAFTLKYEFYSYDTNEQMNDQSN